MMLDVYESRDFAPIADVVNVVSRKMYHSKKEKISSREAVASSKASLV